MRVIKIDIFFIRYTLFFVDFLNFLLQHNMKFNTRSSHHTEIAYETFGAIYPIAFLNL